MTKPIIINGVDVSECIYIDENTIPQDCGVNCSFCYEFKNCYYKQLKRKEQECEKLTDALLKIKKCAVTATRTDYNGFLALQGITAKVNQVLKISEVENE